MEQFSLNTLMKKIPCLFFHLTLLIGAASMKKSSLSCHFNAMKRWNFVYQDKNEEEIFETIEKLDRKFMDMMETQNLQ